MLKSELIRLLVEKVIARHPEMTEKAVIESTQHIIHAIIDTLATKGRMEIRGFGSLDLHYFPARKARNPKTGKTVTMSARYRVRFKTAKQLRLRMNSK